MTHASGPWGIKPTTYGYPGYHVMSADNKQLARVDDIETARLIAAAPDLLAACQSTWHAANIPGIPLPIDTMLEIRAAISKVMKP